jgi:RNA polymerase sigma-70 factor (ECF subfamily)
MSKLREKKRRNEADIEDWSEYIEEIGTLSTEERYVIRECMQVLSDEERQIVLLHALSGFKHREIASMMSLPLATVLSKYSRAVKKLQKRLSE